MISDNDSYNGASAVPAISECGSVKHRLRNKAASAAAVERATASSQPFSNVGGQNTTATALLAATQRHGRRRTAGLVQGEGNAGVGTGAGTNKTNAAQDPGCSRLRPQTRGTTQQQQLLLAQQLPQVSITLIKRPRTEHEQPEAGSSHSHKPPSKAGRSHQSSVSAASKKSQSQTQVIHESCASSQRNFMSNLPYMGELTFDSRPRRGRKPKKADICHLISKNYGIHFPKSASASAPSTLPPLPLPLPLPLPAPKRKKLQPSHSVDGPAITHSHELYGPNSLYASHDPSFPAPASAPPSLVTLQKLYQQKFSAFSLSSRPSQAFTDDDATTDSQPLNLCTRDLEIEDAEDTEGAVAEGEEGEEEAQEEYNNNNSIRSWLGSCAEDECYDNKAKNKRHGKPKTVITVVQKKRPAATNADEEGEGQTGDGSGDENENDGQETVMLIGGGDDDGGDDDEDSLRNDRDAVKRNARATAGQAHKFSSFLVKNHFLCNSDDDGVDEEIDVDVEDRNEESKFDRLGVENPSRSKRRRGTRANANSRPQQQSQERSLALRKPSESQAAAAPSQHQQQWSYHHHQLVPPTRSAAKDKSRPKSSGQRDRNSRGRGRSRMVKKDHPSTSSASTASASAAAAVSAAVAASNNAQVSICKFKFTGGVKPTLQEKKMLSLDSGGNFRFYTDKPLQPAAVNSSVAPGGVFRTSESAAHQQRNCGPGMGSSSNNCKTSPHKSIHHQRGKADGGSKAASCGNVTTTNSLLALPKSAKSMSMCMLPTGSSASVSPASVPGPIASTSSTSLASAVFGKSLISPIILPDITISACPSNNSRHLEPDGDCCGSTKSGSCCNSDHSRSSCCSSSRASSPAGSCRSSCSRSDSEAEADDGDGQNSSGLLQVPLSLHVNRASALSLSSSAAKRPNANSSSSCPPCASRKSPPRLRPHGSHAHALARSHRSSSSNSRRRTKKSVARENLEKTFKEKGFLIQTQQLESSEGVTYCKFRQLKKFTRYLFRSWKDYLPEAVKDSIVISGGGGGGGGGGAGRQSTVAVIKQEEGEDREDAGPLEDDEIEIEPEEDQYEDQVLAQEEAEDEHEEIDV